MNRPDTPLQIKALKAALRDEKAESAVLRIANAMLEKQVARSQELRDSLGRMEATIAALEQEKRRLEEELRLAHAQLYGPKSEKRKDRIFNEAEQAATDDAEGEADGEDEQGAASSGSVVPDTGRPARGDQKTAGKKRGRKPLPADLERESVHYELPEEQQYCSCCEAPLHRIGTAESEQLHIEVKVVVRRNVRSKYACRNCERTGVGNTIILAPMPPQPLPGSVATASALAWVLASKFVDGMPLHRIAASLARAGADISRAALGNWVLQSSERWFQRIHDVLHDRLRGQPIIHGDETRVQVLKEQDRAAEAQSYMWVYRTAEGCAQPIVLFDYQPGRGKVHPQAFLGDFSGTLMTDGYEAWRSAFPNAVHLGCMAHARRRFTDALKAHRSSRLAKEALAFFGALYDVEHLVREGSADLPGDDHVLYMRQTHSVPVLDAFRQWLEEKQPQVLPSSKLGEAISYALNQWDHLILYTKDPRAPIDNNLIERDIKHFVVGRKGWLFADTVRGAKASAVLYSLALTCRASGVNPQAWFAHVLTELPRRRDDDDIEDLMPWNFVADDKLVPDNSG